MEPIYDESGRRLVRMRLQELDDSGAAIDNAEFFVRKDDVAVAREMAVVQAVAIKRQGRKWVRWGDKRDEKDILLRVIRGEFERLNSMIQWVKIDQPQPRARPVPSYVLDIRLDP